MTATHTPARRPHRTRNRRRLPRLHWGWATATVIVTIGAARTWPVYSAITIALAAIGLITAARRPAWLQHAAHRIPINFHRSHLPARGRRTAEAFHQLKPGQFEQAIAELAREDDRVIAATAVGGAGDGGLDVRVQLDNGTHILVQCKRYKQGNNVPARDIRDANGAYRDLHHCHAAVIVTTSDFTAQAYEHNAAFRPPLRLINGRALEAWANGGQPPW